MDAGERKVFLDLLKQVALQWEDHARPEDIRSDMEKLDLLLSINKLVHDDSKKTLLKAMLKSSEDFRRVYRDVMLRSIEETINYDYEPEGSRG